MLMPSPVLSCYLISKLLWFISLLQVVVVQALWFWGAEANHQNKAGGRRHF